MFKCDECARVEVLNEGDTCDTCAKSTKECRVCLAIKSIYEFDKNQRNPSGARNRRGACKNCRQTNLVPVKPKAKREFLKKSPQPKIGDIFECPLCKDIFTLSSNQSVHLDHDQKTGEVRGWVCGQCNTAMGKLGDDITTLARAIIWLKDKGKSFLFMI